MAPSPGAGAHRAIPEHAYRPLITGKPAYKIERLFCMLITTVRRGIAVTTLIAALGAMAACEHSSKQSGKPEGVSATTPTRPADNGVAAKSETEILKAAQDALAHARSVHLKGTIVENGKRTTMDLRVAQKTCSGSVKGRSHGTNARVYVRCTGGRTYIRSPEMIRAAVGPEAARLVGDHWFYSSKERSDPFGGMTTPAGFAKDLTADGPISKGSTTTVNGIPVIGLRDSESVLYIATTGVPYPVRMEPDPPKRGQGLDLLDYNAPLDVVAPPGALDVDHLPR